MATQKIKDYAMRALPYVVSYAQQRSTVTYKELSEKVGCHHHVASHYLRYIRDSICAPQNMPMLTAIVVSQNTHMPGDNWLQEGTGHLSKTEYRAKFEQFRDEVFAYSGWNNLLKGLNLAPVQMSMQALKKAGREYSLMLAHQASGGEGAAHLELKKYIASHPDSIGLKSSTTSEIEHLFISGDRCDVLFTSGKKQYFIAEIKNGEPGELVCGIYQLVKYRALLAAEEELSSDDLPQIHLVAYQIPVEVQKFSAKFEITCHSLPEIPIEKTLNPISKV